MTIYPTHSCFTDAVEFLDELAKAGSEAIHDGSLILVHAIVLHPTEGHKMSHAWVEDQKTGETIWKGILEGEPQYFITPTAEYRAEFRVQQETRYTPQQAVTENLISGTFGPWIEPYKNPEYLRQPQETEKCGRTS